MKISANVTTYNRAILLPETLDAILAQSRPADEVIVVNDGSTDNTAEVLASYGGRVIAINQANTGVQAARNAGFARATGDYVALTDDDDIWEPRYLEAQAALLSIEPDIGISFGNFRNLADGVIGQERKFDQAPSGWWDRLPRRAYPQGWVFDNSIAGATFTFHPVFVSAMVVARALWQRVGGYNPSLGHIGGEDGEFTLRCLYGAKTAALPEPLVLIRRHAGNFSADMARRLQGEILCLRHILANHPEAVQYRAIIEREIRLRQVLTLDAAFAAFNHALARRAFAEIAPADRTAKLWLKRLVAGLPDVLGHPVNVLLQRIVSGDVAAQGPVLR